jgi:hypothetical protein
MIPQGLAGSDGISGVWSIDVVLYKSEFVVIGWQMVEI